MAATRIEVFKQMLESDPSNSTVLFGLANEYLKSEQFHEAADVLEKYLRAADDEGAAYGMLAKAYERLGRAEDARAAYEKGIVVAERHNHPSMASEYRMVLDEF
jgi:predicted Zn-dependent protease